MCSGNKSLSLLVEGYRLDAPCHSEEKDTDRNSIT